MTEEKEAIRGLCDLPHDVLFHVLLVAHARQLNILARTCRCFRDLITGPAHFPFLLKSRIEHRGCLKAAARSGFTDVVIRLLDRGVRPNKTDAFEALVGACRNGYLWIVQILMQTVQLNRLEAVTLLQEASANGHVPIVSHLLHDMYEIGTYGDADKAILLALDRGFPDVVHLLLDRGVRPRVHLRYAVFSRVVETGHIDTVRLMLHRQIHRDDEDSGNQAIMRASKEGHLDIVQFVLDRFHMSRKSLLFAHALATRNGHQDVARLLQRTERVG